MKDFMKEEGEENLSSNNQCYVNRTGIAGGRRYHDDNAPSIGLALDPRIVMGCADRPPLRGKDGGDRTPRSQSGLAQ